MAETGEDRPGGGPQFTATEMRAYLRQMLSLPAGSSLLAARRSWHAQEGQPRAAGSVDAADPFPPDRDITQDASEDLFQRRQRDWEELEFVWKRVAQGDPSQWVSRLVALDSSPWQETRRLADQARAVLDVRTTIEKAFPRDWMPSLRQNVFGLLVRPWSESSDQRASLRRRTAREFGNLGKTQRFLEALPALLPGVDRSHLQQVSAFCLKVATAGNGRPARPSEGLGQRYGLLFPQGTWTRTFINILCGDLPSGFSVAFFGGLVLITLLAAIGSDLLGESAGRAFRAALGIRSRGDQELVQQPGIPSQSPPPKPLAPTITLPRMPEVKPPNPPRSLADEILESERKKRRESANSSSLDITIATIESDLGQLENSIRGSSRGAEGLLREMDAPVWQLKLRQIESQIEFQLRLASPSAAPDPRLLKLQRRCAELSRRLETPRGPPQAKEGRKDPVDDAMRDLFRPRGGLPQRPLLRPKRLEDLFPRRGAPGDRNPPAPAPGERDGSSIWPKLRPAPPRQRPERSIGSARPVLVGMLSGPSAKSPVREFAQLGASSGEGVGPRYALVMGRLL